MLYIVGYIKPARGSPRNAHRTLPSTASLTHCLPSILISVAEIMLYSIEQRIFVVEEYVHTTLIKSVREKSSEVNAHA